jgi:hypothetical protein
LDAKVEALHAARVDKTSGPKQNDTQDLYTTASTASRRPPLGSWPGVARIRDEPSQKQSVYRFTAAAVSRKA